MVAVTVAAVMVGVVTEEVVTGAVATAAMAVQAGMDLVQEEMVVPAATEDPAEMVRALVQAVATVAMAAQAGMDPVLGQTEVPAVMVAMEATLVREVRPARAVPAVQVGKAGPVEALALPARRVHQAAPRPVPVRRVSLPQFVAWRTDHVIGAM